MTEPGGLALDAGRAGPDAGRAARGRRRTVTAVTAEVPGYAGALTGQMGATIAAAVQTALGAFLRPGRAGARLRPQHAAAAGARRGVRAGPRRGAQRPDAWTRCSRRTASAPGCPGASGRRPPSTAGLPAGDVAQFAELVFAYIDQLSAASVAGHTDELETTGRVRQRYLERLAQAAAVRRDADVLEAAAERADWAPPTELTAVLLPTAASRGPLALLDPRTLALSADDAGVPADVPTTVLLVPGARAPLLRGARGAARGRRPDPAVDAGAVSFARAVRALPLAGTDGMSTPSSTWRSWC